MGTTRKPTLDSLAAEVMQLTDQVALLVQAMTGTAPKAADAPKAEAPKAQDDDVAYFQAFADMMGRAGGTLADLAPEARKASKAAKKATKKAAAKKAAPTQGSQPKAALGRKVWNDTLCSKARFAGKRADGITVYRAILNDWVNVAADRAAGVTPDEVLAKYL